MVWNYRVMRCVSDAGEVNFGVHEVYYNDETTDSPRAYSADAMAPYGETFEELRKDFARFEAALTKPVLTPEDFPSGVDCD